MWRSWLKPLLSLSLSLFFWGGGICTLWMWTPRSIGPFYMYIVPETVGLMKFESQITVTPCTLKN